MESLEAKTLAESSVKATAHGPATGVFPRRLWAFLAAAGTAADRESASQPAVPRTLCGQAVFPAARLGLGRREPAEFADLTQQAMTQRALRSQFIQQGLGLVEGLRVRVRLLQNQLVTTPDFCFGKQIEFLACSRKNPSALVSTTAHYRGRFRIVDHHFMVSVRHCNSGGTHTSVVEAAARNSAIGPDQPAAC